MVALLPTVELDEDVGDDPVGLSSNNIVIAICESLISPGQTSPGLAFPTLRPVIDILFLDAWLLPRGPQYQGDCWGSWQENHTQRHPGILPSKPMIEEEICRGVSEAAR